MRILPSVKILAACLLIGSIPLVTARLIPDGIDAAQAERDAIASMAAIAESKAACLDALGLARVHELAVFAADPACVRAAVALAEASAGQGTRTAATAEAESAEAQKAIDAFARNCEMPRLTLIDREGRIVYATAGHALLGRSVAEDSLAGTGLARVLGAVARDGVTRPVPPNPEERGDRPLVEIVARLMQDGTAVGFAVASIDPARIESVMTDYTGLGKSGDIVAIAMSGNEVVATSGSRTNPELLLTKLVRRGEPTLRRHQELLYGSPFRGVSPDTAGVESAGAWVRVPSLAWGIVVTQHLSEVRAPELALRAQQDFVALVSAAAVAVASVAAAILLSIGRSERAVHGAA